MRFRSAIRSTDHENTLMPNLTMRIPLALCSLLVTVPTLPANAHHSYSMFDQKVCDDGRSPVDLTPPEGD